MKKKVKKEIEPVVKRRLLYREGLYNSEFGSMYRKRVAYAPKLEMSAVVIFSGGQDSTTCLMYALQKYKKVYAITFNYGQKHSVELKCSKEICKKFGVKQTVINMNFLKTVADSALLLKDGDVNEKNEKGLPSSFVPNRNQLFITIAHAFAQKVKASVLVTGVCETDFSGYPDCRNEFIRSIETSSNKGSDSCIFIETPLMFLNKSQTFELAHTLGDESWDAVIRMSHTCYNGDRTKFNKWGYGCGTCPACKLRKKGYNEFVKWWNYKVGYRGEFQADYLISVYSKGKSGVLTKEILENFSSKVGR